MAEEPLTVFKCPCGRYIISSTGLDDHLKSCSVQLEQVNWPMSRYGCQTEDDTSVIMW